MALDVAHQGREAAVRSIALERPSSYSGQVSANAKLTFLNHNLLQRAVFSSTSSNFGEADFVSPNAIAVSTILALIAAKSPAAVLNTPPISTPQFVHTSISAVPLP